jgi:hypothetical protein
MRRIKILMGARNVGRKPDITAIGEKRRKIRKPFP